MEHSTSLALSFLGQLSFAFLQNTLENPKPLIFKKPLKLPAPQVFLQGFFLGSFTSALRALAPSMEADLRTLMKVKFLAPLLTLFWAILVPLLLVLLSFLQDLPPWSQSQRLLVNI